MNPKKVKWVPKKKRKKNKKKTAQLFPILIINQHIRMISEGSRDTEDWSNDAENSALITEINYILKYIK